MEITINIPKNNYVRPTEVRQEVVQDICNYIIRFFERDDVVGITVYDSNYHKAELWYSRSTNFRGEPYIMFATSVKASETDKYVRVRGCEMQAVFDAMIAAGYFISGSYCNTTQKHTYLFTYKPDKYGNLVTKFTRFID